MALFQDRRGRFHRADGSMASAGEIARARKVTFADLKGRRRERTGKAARALAPKVRAKVAQKAATVKALQAALNKPKGRARTRAINALPRGRKPLTFKPQGRQPAGREGRKRRGTETDRERHRTLEEVFGVKLRSSDDFASLIEAQPESETLARASFSIADPVSETEDRSIYEGVRGAAHELLDGTGLRSEKIFALTVAVSVRGEQLSSDVFTASYDLDLVVGACVRTIMQALAQRGYYASDGDIGQELAETGARRARNLHVEMTAVRLRGDS